MADATGESISEQELQKLLAEGIAVLQSFKDDAKEQAQTPAVNPDNDKDVQEWKQAILHGMSNRMKQGQRFDRAHDGGKSEKYKELKTNEQRTEFKLNWGRTKLEAKS